ncbi:MAG: hypothetical protein HY897_11505 [Deltaproteobacteria bacterium]|nr:hypothetical protein [Deltaproteobacteria bacterium]
MNTDADFVAEWTDDCVGRSGHIPNPACVEGCRTISRDDLLVLSLPMAIDTRRGRLLVEFSGAEPFAYDALG